MNSDDCSFLILTHYIFKELIKIPDKYCHILFKLFRLCFRNIFEAENITIKIDSSFLIKRLYNFLEELITTKDLKYKNNKILIICIDEFLHILEIATLNCEHSLLNAFLYKIQYLITMIYKKYDLVKEYFESESRENSSNKTGEINNTLSKTFST